MSHRSELHLFWTIDTVLSARLGVPLRKNLKAFGHCILVTLLISSTASDEDSSSMAFYIL